MSGDAPLRVAFDISTTRLGNAGVARAARDLSRAIGELHDVELIEIGSGARPDGRTSEHRRVALQVDLLWALRGVARVASEQRADVLHLPLPRGPVTRSGIPTVVTVHDLAVLRFPETLSRWNRHYSLRTLPKVLRAADAVVAVSENTAADVAAWLPDVADRLNVVPNGVDVYWFESSGPATLDAPYVLAVGTPEPRKNLSRLVEAMRRRRAAGAGELLVHVGSDGWGDAAIPDESWIIQMGRVDDGVLRSLYKGASALAIPSLHEGSGMPVLEAFAAGAPVVAARSGGLPETCGDAAVLVDPLDSEDIARGIDSAIAQREALVEAGRARAERMRWDNAARAYAAIYGNLT